MWVAQTCAILRVRVGAAQESLESAFFYMSRSTRLVILNQNMYTLLGGKRFLPADTYFPTNVIFHFTFNVYCCLISKYDILLG